MSKIYRNNTFMFRKNHSKPTHVIHGVWDEAKKKGLKNVEINTMNAYVDREYYDVENFDSREELLKSLGKCIAEHVENVADDIDDGCDSEKTFLFTIIKNKEIETIKFPSLPISIVEDGDKCLIQIHGVAPLKLREGDILFVDVSNDPTPNMAGSSISLGYYSWLFKLKNPKVVKTNPFIIVGKRADMNYKLVRPCRRTL